jgi:hypothetical protein
VTEPPGAQAAAALNNLAATHPDLAATLARFTVALSKEATRSARLAQALAAALEPPATPSERKQAPSRGVRRTRRNPGPWDPFSIYAEEGVSVLRDRLTELDLEQLRDIVAEHGMDTDRLAMKWKDPSRVVDRIVERVVDRAAKGDAFRGD